MENKKTNKENGFYYEVTDEQIREHQQRSLSEIFEWLEKQRELMQGLKTPEEKKRSK